MIDDAVDLYLDLLIRCLTNTIYGDDSVAPWCAPKYDPEFRRQGADWPTVAHTMIGVLRMESLRDLAIKVLVNKVPGDFIETGVWRGGACILMRGVLKALGDTERLVYVADSFQGLPRPDAQNYPADAGQTIHEVQYLAVSSKTVANNFATYGLLDKQVVFVEGWFKDTLPDIPPNPLALIRLDGDLYESTIQALEVLYPMLSVGGYLIVDDYHSWPTCRAAVDHYRALNGIYDEIVKIDLAGVYWQKGEN